jgi:hypothetical protein
MVIPDFGAEADSPLEMGYRFLDRIDREHQPTFA